MACIIMEMNTKPISRNHGQYIVNNRLNLMGQGAAVCIAQHDPACAIVKGCSGAGKGIVPICLVAVKKVLGVVHGFFAGVDSCGDGVADHGQVFFVRDLKRNIDLIGP